MEVSATAKFIRISPKKVQPMVVALRKMPVSDALIHLKYHSSKTAKLIYKLIHSASANATNNYNLKENNLRIKTLTVDTGPTMKRYWFRSHGSADPLLKRSSHMSVTLEEINPSLVKKPVVPSQASKPATTPVSPSTPTTETTGEKTTVQSKAMAPKPKFAQGLKKIITRRTTNK